MTLENNLKVIGSGKHFQNRTPITQVLGSTIRKQPHETKSSARQRTSSFRQYGNISTPTTYNSDRGLLSKIYKELEQLDINEINNPICKGVCF